MHARRNFGLDLARALAITMVFLSHGVTFFGSLGVGVDLFFVLSGFLIGRIYLRSQADAHESAGTFTLWSFWSARWFRTLPPYFAALSLFALAQPYFHNNPTPLYYILFLQNYLGDVGFGPSWSLCVEEHFYLALPLLGFVALRIFRRRHLVWLLPLLAIVPLSLRISGVLRNNLPAAWFWQTHLHCEGLLLGVWLAFVFLDRPALWQRLYRPSFLFALIPFGLLLHEKLHRTVISFDQPPVYHPFSLQILSFLLYAIGYTAWIRILYDLRWNPVVSPARLLKSLIHGTALASYSIYLVHTLLFTDLRVLIDAWPRGIVKSGTILGGTVVGCIAFYFAVERPTILLRDRVIRGSRVASANSSAV